MLAELPAILTAACPATRYAVIADSAVAELYAADLATALDAALFTFPAGEWNKTRETWGAISDRLLDAGLGRDCALLAVGGGVTGDLAGFVAATYLRGVPYVQVPTTLLAMIDSSIGGKTGVDTSHGKNLIGAFHQPRAVVADIATLATLSPPQLAAGMAEALKHGLLADAAYGDMLSAQHDRIVARDPATLTDVVTRGIAIKAEVVAADERESGRRAILNLGHTVAHAIEQVSGYEILHGEAVAIGLVVEADLGVRVGVTAEDVPRRIGAALERFGLPTTLPDAPSHVLLDAMRTDKKARGGTVRFAFLSDIGKPARGSAGEWTFSVPEPLIIECLDQNR